MYGRSLLLRYQRHDYLLEILQNAIFPWQRTLLGLFCNECGHLLKWIYVNENDSSTLKESGDKQRWPYLRIILLMCIHKHRHFAINPNWFLEVLAVIVLHRNFSLWIFVFNSLSCHLAFVSIFHCSVRLKYHCV